ncbi:spermatogenesis-associated protein 4 [Pleuronectes platessa]|uniref:spermatogenesis-associated protein 4 n=1 Tax=Pleuronectes platessa TaxID=8262 RepID=UPI00232A6E36|nr:spermatogenesis-associated protein 4 [Pleuronectes platessa]
MLVCSAARLSLCPQPTGVSREVVKWLQSFYLTFHVKNVLRIFSSGYLVAEICSCYCPQHFPEHSFYRGTSLSAKQRNWSRIERITIKLSQKQSLRLTKEVVDGTIHCKPGAAELLIRDTPVTTYTHHCFIVDLNIRNPEGLEFDLTRSTASKVIKNNLRITEIMATPDIRTERGRNPGRL